MTEWITIDVWVVNIYDKNGTNYDWKGDLKKWDSKYFSRKSDAELYAYTLSNNWIHKTRKERAVEHQSGEIYLLDSAIQINN